MSLLAFLPLGKNLRDDCLKKIISLLLLSVLLLAGGCARANAPKAFLLPKCPGSVVFDEKRFDVQLDFSGEEKAVILKTEKNAFDTCYYFRGETVKLQYDTISTELDLGALPDTNIAALLYKMIRAAQQGKVKWEKAESGYLFHAALGGVDFSGTCKADGTLISLEVPEYRFYFKAQE